MAAGQIPSVGLLEEPSQKPLQPFGVECNRGGAELGADPRPFEPLPEPPCAPRSRWRYNRLAKQLRAAEVRCFTDQGVTRSSLERRKRESDGRSG